MNMNDSPFQPQTMRDDLVKCDVTGKPTPPEDIVEFQGKRVSAEGKDILLRQLREGGDAPAALRPPTLGSRFGCAIVDNIALRIIETVAVFAIGPATAAVVNMQGSVEYKLFLLILLLILCGVPMVAYPALMHAHGGRTLGKMLGGFRVVYLDGAPIRPWTAWVRAFWFVGVPYLFTVFASLTGDLWGEEISPAWGTLALIGPLYSIANGIVLLTDSRYYRAIHDRMAGTRVVLDRS